MRCGVWPKREMVVLRRIAQVIENRARLHPCQLFVRVDLENAVHVFRQIEYDCDVTALSCKASTPATCEKRRT